MLTIKPERVFWFGVSIKSVIVDTITCGKIWCNFYCIFAAIFSGIIFLCVDDCSENDQKWRVCLSTAKSVDKPNEQILSKCIPSTTAGRYITPMSLALSPADGVKATTEVDIGITEQEPDFEASSLALSKWFPTYWSRLDSSKYPSH